MKKSRKTAQPHHGENVGDFSQDLKNDRNVMKMKMGFFHILMTLRLVKKHEGLFETPSN